MNKIGTKLAKLAKKTYGAHLEANKTYEENEIFQDFFSSNQFLKLNRLNTILENRFFLGTGHK